MHRAIITAALFAGTALAADWQMGGQAGYGIYKNGSVIAPAGTVSAGIRNRFAVSVFATDDMYEHISGEIRYTYQDGDPFLSGAGKQVNVQGQSHAFHYDVLFHVHPRQQKIRPYVALGAGAKLYVVSGPAPVSPPFGNVATLTSRDEAKPVVSVGAGVKIRWKEHIDICVDFRDYITTFPKKLITPAANATGRGIFHQFTPLAGLSYVF